MVDEGAAALTALSAITVVVALQPLEVTVLGVSMNWVLVAMIVLGGYAGILR